MEYTDAVRTHMARQGKTPNDAITFGDLIQVHESEEAANAEQSPDLKASAAPADTAPATPRVIDISQRPE